MTSQLCRLKVTRAMLDLLTSSSGDKTRTAYMQLWSDGKIVFANITMHACGMQCLFLCFFICQSLPKLFPHSTQLLNGNLLCARAISPMYSTYTLKKNAATLLVFFLLYRSPKKLLLQAAMCRWRKAPLGWQPWFFFWALLRSQETLLHQRALCRWMKTLGWEPQYRH